MSRCRQKKLDDTCGRTRTAFHDGLSARSGLEFSTRLAFGDPIAHALDIGSRQFGDSDLPDARFDVATNPSSVDLNGG